MLLAITSKALLTALVIISVAKGVERFGPRFGGILAGAPVVVGPAYFFLVTENDVAFIISAALSSMNAMTATLLFTALYQLLPHLTPLSLALVLSSAAWLISVALLQTNVESVLLSSMLFAATYITVKILASQVQATIHRQNQSTCFDIAYKAVAAGILVGAGTGLTSYTGASLSGVIVGFPIGLTIIVITLHYRHGPDVAKTTLATAQTGMISIFSFLLALSHLATFLSPLSAFILSIATALIVTLSFLLFEFFSLIGPFPPNDNDRR
ncbi:hypothetical protein [Marinobacterium zhoushanense]|uniref:hypothetical protein n=1 Tax=Marinobacterium zhoushanense TaxID=1679163 RepID=UPI001664B91B|nr:hypothetical protein [Marinobacterium zhoushanense]